MNVVTFVGNLGRDPEVRYAASGTPVAKLAVAINEVHTVSGERREKTVWVGVEAWGKQAEAVGKYCKKGDRVGVTGALDESVWQKDGKEQRRLFIRAVSVDFLQARGSAPGSTGSPSSGPPDEPAPPKQAPESQSTTKGAGGGHFDDFESDVPF